MEQSAFLNQIHYNNLKKKKKKTKDIYLWIF